MNKKGLTGLVLLWVKWKTAAELNPEYKDMAEAVSNSYYMLEEVAGSLRSQLDNLEYDPQRLNEIEDSIK